MVVEECCISSSELCAVSAIQPSVPPAWQRRVNRTGPLSLERVYSRPRWVEIVVVFLGSASHPHARVENEGRYTKDTDI